MYKAFVQKKWDVKYRPQELVEFKIGLANFKIDQNYKMLIDTIITK